MITQGEHGVPYPFTTYNDGVLNLTGAVVEVDLTKPDGTLVTKIAEILDAVNGKCQFVLSSSDLSLQGTYKYQWRAFFEGGMIRSMREFDFYVHGSSRASGTGEISETNVIPFVRVTEFDTLKDYVDTIVLEGGSVVQESDTNGNILLNNAELKVYDDTPITTQLSALSQDVTELQQNPGGGGSGILIYDTLTELQAAYPNGLNQPVWIKEDKSWYYWEGTVTSPSDTTAPVLTITAGGTFTGTKTVTLSVDETADIFYTLDGSIPTTASAKYTVPLSISATTTLKAFAKDTAGNQSTVQTVTYTLDTTTPADTTAPNNVTNLQATPTANSVALSWTASSSSDVASYDIYNGSTLIGNVTGTSFNVTSLTASTQYTFSVRAKDGANNVASGTSVSTTTLVPADTTAPTLTVTPAATFADTQTVTMAANETATIWYTVDGSDPTTSGTRVQYTTAVTLTATTTVKAYAVDSANNASAVQTVTYTKEIAYSDYALSFNGTSSNATSANSINITGNSARTMEVRFKATTVPSGNAGKVLFGWGGNGTTTANLSTLMLYRGAAGQPCPVVFYNRSTTVSAVTDIVAGTWYHIVAVFDGTTCKMFVNGVQTNSATVSGTNTIATPLSLATDNGGVSTFQYFNGQIDYVRVYNTALTATDVANNYNGTVQRTGLLHEWLITEGSGTTTADTVNGNTITTNSTTWVGI